MALPDRIYAHASPLSIRGRSLFAAKEYINSLNSAEFSSYPNMVSAAMLLLQEAGFEILQVSPVTINIAGTPDAFEKAFRTKIVEKELARPNGPTSTHLDSPDTETLGLISTAGTRFSEVIEGIGLEVPRAFLQTAATPPNVDYWHLDVPADLARGCSAATVHRLGITGRDVKVAMVDSGWFGHPYFAAHGYSVAPVVLGPGATEPGNDESGHGTGESANIFAIAPDCLLLPVKANFVNTIGAFNTAVALQPDIISCSWGSHSPFLLSAADMVLAASVGAAVSSGITVIFSAGNGHAGFPGQHPDVISAGGVFMRRDGTLEASNYSSAFRSVIYPLRRVPDLCGMVGMRPRGIYIMLPVQPGDKIDTGNAGIFPDGDQTATDDGWAAFSGTSAAAPQLAGAAALIKQVAPELTSSAVKAALIATARDVTEGMCSPVMDLHGGVPAGPGPDDATGAGLVEVSSAVLTVYAASLAGAWDTTDAWYPLGTRIAAYYAAGMAASAGARPAAAAYLRGLLDSYAALARWC